MSYNLGSFGAYIPDLWVELEQSGAKRFFKVEMFLGSYELKLDDKGRLMLPRASKDLLADGLYLTRGQDRCLFVFTEPQFELYKNQTKENAPENIPLMAFDRMLFSSVSTQVPDKQGRITLPAPLRAYADLKKNVVLVGLENRIEIWDAAHWDEYVRRYEDSFAEIKEGIR
jgi:MraZ protein